MKRNVFEGSAVALVTPMKEDNSVNYDVLERLIDFHINNRTDAIVVCGTTGESATLSDVEHREIIRFTVNKVGRRIPVIAGTGSNDTKHAVALSKSAEDVGADAVLVVTPYYNKASQRGLTEHYTMIADSIKLPVILYNVPSRTGCDIAPETCLALSRHENIVAIKQASGDISSTIKIRALCGEDLTIYSGNDDQTVPMLSLGAVGVISVFANVCPKVSHDIVRAFLDMNVKKSREILYDYIDLMNALFCDVNPIPVKAAMSLLNINCGECRLPLTPLSEHKLLYLKKLMQEHKII